MGCRGGRRQFRGCGLRARGGALRTARLRHGTQARSGHQAPHHRDHRQGSRRADLAQPRAGGAGAARGTRAPVCAQPAQPVVGRARLLLPHHRHAQRHALAGGRTARARCRPAPAAILHQCGARRRWLAGRRPRPRALPGRRRRRQVARGRTHRPRPRRRFPLRHRVRIRRPAIARARCPALLHQQALRARLHRLGRAESDRRAGRACAAAQECPHAQSGHRRFPATHPRTRGPAGRRDTHDDARRPGALRWSRVANRRAGSDADRRCRRHRLAGDRRRDPLGMATRLARGRSHRATRARRWPAAGTSWPHKPRRAFASSARCAGPTTMPRSTGHSICCCTRRRCGGLPSRSISTNAARSMHRVGSNEPANRWIECRAGRTSAPTRAKTHPHRASQGSVRDAQRARRPAGSWSPRLPRPCIR